jgi:hypothetical protein
MAYDDTRDDAALVAQAASGSDLAFRTLYRAYVRLRTGWWETPPTRRT